MNNILKYKNQFTAFIAIFVFMAFITSCDIIDEPYREKTTQDTTKTVKRKILLEEFTGFRCKNCPHAAETIHSLLEIYGDQLIPISYHSGYYATPKPSAAWSYDFRTEVGTAIDDFFGVSSGFGNPSGMVNRLNYPTKNHIYGPDSWDGMIKSMENDAPKMTIELTPKFIESSNKITVDATVKYLKAGTSNQNIVVCIIEDSVVNYQLVDNIDSLHYVHNHVFRAGMNGTWGEQLSSTEIKAGTVITKSYQYIIPSTSDWRTKKLSIVAYIFDYGQTYEVYQAELKSLFQ